MATAIESGIGTLNYVKQAAKGTVGSAASVAVGSNRPRWFEGSLKVAKRLDQEPYIDGQRFASPQMFTDAVGGEVGDLTVQIQPENGGLWWAQILGVDTVTGAADPYTHTITSAASSGAWGTFWQKVGSAVGPDRLRFVDCKVAQLTETAGVDQKVLHHELAVRSLAPGQVYAADAAKTEDTSDSYLFTELTGSIVFDGTVVQEIETETITVNTEMEPFYGDSIFPLQLIEKKGTIVRTVDSIVTDDTLGKYRKAIWNAAAPATDAVPVKDVFYAALTSKFTRSATRTLERTCPKVTVRPDDFEIAAQREAGKIPISFGGECLKSGASPALTVVALTGDATAYV